MAVDLNITNHFAMTSRSVLFAGQQGEDGEDADSPFAVSVTGDAHVVSRSLATATVVTVWDDDNDIPTDWDFLYFVADVDMYIQIISTTNVIFKVLAYVPFTLTYDSLLAAADASIITGGTEPTLVDIDSVVIGNYSGGAGNYYFAVVD